MIFKILYFLLLCNIVIGQNTNSLSIQQSTNISRHIDYLESKSANEIDKIKDILSQLNKELSNSQFKSIVAGVIFHTIKYDSIDVEIFLSELKKKFDSRDFITSIDFNNLNTLSKNIEYLKLVLIGVIDRNNKFKINLELFNEEIKNYNLKHTDNVLEIGAGTGEFSQLILLTGLLRHLFINELGLKQLEHLSNSFNTIDSLFDIPKFTVIKGTDENTGVDKKFDKIIIRNTLHHFNKKKKMLNSIRNNLIEGGSLIILETPKEKKKNSSDCKQKMTFKEIYKLLIKNDFILENKKYLNNGILITFKDKKKR